MNNTTLREHLLAQADTPEIAQRLATQRGLVLASLPAEREGGILSGLRILYHELIQRCRPAWAAVALIWIVTSLFNITARLNDTSEPRATPAQIALLIAWARLRDYPAEGGMIDHFSPPTQTGALHAESPSAAC